MTEKGDLLGLLNSEIDNLIKKDEHLGHTPWVLIASLSALVWTAISTDTYSYFFKRSLFFTLVAIILVRTVYKIIASGTTKGDHPSRGRVRYIRDIYKRNTKQYIFDSVQSFLALLIVIDIQSFLTRPVSFSLKLLFSIGIINTFLGAISSRDKKTLLYSDGILNKIVTLAVFILSICILVVFYFYVKIIFPYFSPMDHQKVTFIAICCGIVYICEKLFARSSNPKIEKLQLLRRELVLGINSTEEVQNAIEQEFFGIHFMDLYRDKVNLIKNELNQLNQRSISQLELQKQIQAINSIINRDKPRGLPIDHLMQAQTVMGSQYNNDLRENEIRSRLVRDLLAQLKRELRPHMLLGQDIKSIVKQELDPLTTLASKVALSIDALERFNPYLL